MGLPADLAFFQKFYIWVKFTRLHFKALFLLLPFAPLAVKAQSEKQVLTGTYADFATELTLNADSSFILKTIDPVYPFLGTRYENKGTWTSAGREVILNPGKEKRVPVLTLKEHRIEGADSVQIQVRYYQALYKNEQLQELKEADFDQLTVFLNNRKHYRTLRHMPSFRGCMFAPKVRFQEVVGTTNTFYIAAQPLRTLGIFTYGFAKEVMLPVQSNVSNFFEITVVQPLGAERMPRRKHVIVKRGVAYFYERQGEINTSEWRGGGLQKVR